MADVQKAVKKAILFGMGVYQISREKVEGFVKDLQKDGDLTPEEGRKVVDEVLGKLDKEKDRFSAEVERIVKQVIVDLELVSEADLKKKSGKKTTAKPKKPTSQKKTTSKKK